MPQRFLKPGLTTSEKWNQIQFDAQSLYIRLITVVDDYGRFDGRASVIHGSCFSVWNDQNPSLQMDVVKVTALCQQLADVGLIRFYTILANGKRFLEVTNWTERARTPSKWPNPEECQQNVVKVPAPCAPPSTSTSTSPSPSPSPLSNMGEVALGENGERTVALMERCKAVLGEQEMKKCHKRWYNRARQNSEKLERVLADMEEHAKNNGKYTNSAGARAEQLWKEFK